MEEVARVARVSERHGVTWIEVEPGRLREVVEKLVEMGYDHVASLTVVDEPGEGRLRVRYVLESYDESGRLVVVEVSVDRGNPRLPSLSDILPSIVLQEREAWEMFGVVFEGHPDLRHLLLPEDWPEGVYPLRKDFVVKEEPITAPPELQRLAEEEWARLSGRGEKRGQQS